MSSRTTYPSWRRAFNASSRWAGERQQDRGRFVSGWEADSGPIDVLFGGRVCRCSGVQVVGGCGSTRGQGGGGRHTVRGELIGCCFPDLGGWLSGGQRGQQSGE